MGQTERGYDKPNHYYIADMDQAKRPHKEKNDEKPKAKQLSWFDKILRVVFGLVVLAAVAFGVWHLVKSHHSNPLPATVRKSVSFSLYYPTAEPAGYHLDSSSIKSAGGTVSYNFVRPPQNPIVITQEAFPKNFDPQTLLQHNNLPTTVSPLGTVYDLSYKNQSRYMISANSSLIFISSNTKISNAQLQQIVNGLKASK